MAVGPIEAPGIEQQVDTNLQLVDSANEFLDEQIPYEGFFSNTNPIVDRELIETDRTKRGATTLEIVTLADGQHYEHVKGVPKNQKVDVRKHIGTALGTSIYGHNWHTMLKMMEQGYVVDLIGPEGGHARWPHSWEGIKQIAHNLTSIGVMRTAQNMHEIIADSSQDELTLPNKVIKEGESRDGAVAVAFNAVAEEYGVQVIYTESIAACFPKPKPITLGRESLPRLGEIGTQVASLGKTALKMNVSQLRHYHRTVNPNPYFFAHMIATVPALVSGQAGKAAKRIERDTQMHHTHFIDDPWSLQGGWEKVFNNHPNVLHDLLEGDHGGIVDPRVQAARFARSRALAEGLANSGNRPTKDDWDYIHRAGDAYIDELRVSF
jgi:hypothetical protein